MAPRSVTHTLAHPFKVGEVSYTSVTFVEPDVEKLEMIDDLGIEDGKNMRVRQIREVMQILSGLPEEAVKRVQRADFEKMGEIIGPLLSDTEAGAEKSEIASSSPSPAGSQPPTSI